MTGGPATSDVSRASLYHLNPDEPGAFASRAKAAEGSTSRRLKVLVGAYACSPSRGSEYGVGWGWAEAISKYHDLWILTGGQCREEIEAELSRRP